MIVKFHWLEQLNKFCYEKGFRDFESKYITLLEAGGSLHYKELLSPFKLNPAKTNFWSKGLNLIDDLIDQLEDL